MTNFIDDNPIGTQGIDNDAFHRKAYAENIAKSILSEELKDINVYSIEGSWGCGKSSLINLVKHQIRTKEKDTIIIDFKPWNFSKKASIQEKFVEVLYSQFIKDKPKIANSILDYGITLAPGALTLACMAVPGLAVLNHINWNEIKKQFKKIIGSIETQAENSIESRKNNINQELNKLINHVVIFIDDIDRLAPDEVLEILKLVREVANFNNVKYILAYDRSYVDKIVSEANFPNPYQYLNKIINFAYPVPKITKKQYDEYFESFLARISSAHPEIKIDDDFPMAFNYKVKALLTTPREIKALINRIMFVGINLNKEFKLSEIIQLESIFLSAPQLYEHIRLHPEAYMGFDINRPVQTEDPQKIASEYKDDRNAILEAGKFSETKKRTLKLIINELFPHTSEQKGIISSRGGYINTKDGFAKYFHYSLPQELVTIDDIKNFFKGNESENILNKYIHDGKKLKNLMDNLVDLVMNGNQDLELVEQSTIRNLSDLFLDIYLSDYEYTFQGFLQLGPLDRAWQIIFRFFETNPNILNDFINDQIRNKKSSYLILKLFDRFKRTIPEEVKSEVKRYLQESMDNLNIFNQYIDREIFMEAIEYFTNIKLDEFKSKFSIQHLRQFPCCITSQAVDSTNRVYVSPPNNKVYNFFEDEWLQSLIPDEMSKVANFTPATQAAISAIKNKKIAYISDFKQKKE